MRRLALVAALTLAMTPACRGPGRLVAASGTILVDTGLADALARRWLDAGGDRIAVRAVGSGEAFRLARQDEVDLLFVHEPKGLRALMEEGRVAARRTFLADPWVMVGPPGDPAGVAGAASFADAMTRVARARAPFVSRGDASGTHVRELDAWRAAGVDPAGASWYATTGQGQADTLHAADEQEAYALTDAATYRVLAGGLRLRNWTIPDPDATTRYVAVALRGPRQRAAQRFVAFLGRPDVVRFIERYGSRDHGRPLFGAP